MISGFMIVIAGLIHLIPVTGVLGGQHLARLYGFELEGANILILMQHRAILFALLGIFLIYSAFFRDLQILASAAALISAGSFIVISWMTGDYNDQIRKVVIADIVVVMCSASVPLIHTIKMFNTAR